MVYHINSKNLLFVEPCLSSQHFIHQAKLKGYGIFVISKNESYLALPQKNFTAASAFFQLDTHNEESVLNLVKQISEKFTIDGVIPGHDYYGVLTAKIATYLKTPGLPPEIAFKMTSIEKQFLQHGILREECLHGKEYNINGLINNKVIYIVSFTEKFVSEEKNFLELGYIVKSEIDQVHFKSIDTYLQDIISILKINYGSFYAKVKLLEKGPILLNFSINLVKSFMPSLTGYATGIDYYDNIFKLFSGQPLSLYRVKNLNAGIVFFYKKFVKKNNLNEYFKILLQNPLIIEAKGYGKEDKDLQGISGEAQKIGHAILIHEDCNILKSHMNKLHKGLPDRVRSF